MVNLVEFLVGQQYENRKGVYEVLEVQGEVMRIRWQDGVELDTTVIMQSHIISSMQLELKRITNAKAASPLRESAASNGWHRTRS